MFIITLLLIFVCTSSDQNIFDKTADGIFEEIIGDIYEYSKRVDPPKKYSLVEPQEHDQSLINVHTTDAVNIVTPLPMKDRPNITADAIKEKIRRIELKNMIDDYTSQMPDFSNDADNPDLITRRFEQIVKQESFDKPSLRQEYFNYENKTRLQAEKRRTISLMEHFIYETRYRLPFVQMLRLKYNYHVKYQIGYCFSLLRFLKQQQKMMFTSLMNSYQTHQNLMFHLKIYEKVVRLDVDIRDLVKLIRRLDYQRKLEEDPLYYDDTVEVMDAESSPHGNIPQDDPTEQSNKFSPTAPTTPSK